MKFHDGEPFDAKAVVWNFERWMNTKHPQHENQLKAGQTFEYFEGQFDGFDDKSVIAKVEAIGTHTVKFTLRQPQAPFLENMAMFPFGIASPKAVEKWGTEYGKHPVGTGAFKFVEWKPNQEVVLEANPDYWGKKPSVKRAVVRNIKDNSQRVAALKAGEVHGIEGINPDDLKVVKADSNLQVQLRPTNTTGYVAFNFKVKEFQDKRVRQAIAHAINKKAIVDALYGGTGLVATQFQPPPLWGYNKELKDYEYSPAKAQELLKQAGFPNGLSEITWEDGKKEPLVFWYMSRSRPYFPNPKEIGEAIAADLAKVGIKGQLQTVEWADYLDKRKNGELPLYMLGWTGDNGDPDNFLCYFFCPDKPSREGFHSNPPLSDLLKRASTLTSQTERAKLYRQAEQMIHDNVSRVFIANNEPPLAFSKKVKGYVPSPLDDERFNTVRSSSARRPCRRTGSRCGATPSGGASPSSPSSSASRSSSSASSTSSPVTPRSPCSASGRLPRRSPQVRARLGLDRPIHEQYLLYIGKAIRGDLGVSIVRGDPVFTDILRRFPATVELAVAAIVLAVLFGIPIGIVVRRLAEVADRQPLPRPRADRRLDADLLAGRDAGLGLRRRAPLAADRARLDSSADYEPWTHFVLVDAVLQRNWAMIPDALRHLVLPAVALATIPLAVIARMMRASMLEVLSRDYIRTADAKGLSRAAVVLRHGLRNALLPVLTVVGPPGGLAAGGGDPDRDDLLLAGDRALAVRVDRVARLPDRPGREPVHRRHRGHGQPLDGPPLRRGRSADQVRLSREHPGGDSRGGRGSAARGQSPAAAAWRRLLREPGGAGGARDRVRVRPGRGPRAAGPPLRPQDGLEPGRAAQGAERRASRSAPTRSGVTTWCG